MRLPIDAARLVGAVAVALTLQATAARALDDLPPIYLGVIAGEGGRPVVKFVLSDPAAPGTYRPERAYSIRPGNRDCNSAKDPDLWLPPEYGRYPVYDPSDPERRIAVEALPDYLARFATAELAQAGFGGGGTALRPYYTCTRALFEWLTLVRE